MNLTHDQVVGDSTAPFIKENGLLIVGLKGSGASCLRAAFQNAHRVGKLSYAPERDDSAWAMVGDTQLPAMHFTNSFRMKTGNGLCQPLHSCCGGCPSGFRKLLHSIVRGRCAFEASQPLGVHHFRSFFFIRESQVAKCAAGVSDP